MKIYSPVKPGSGCDYHRIILPLSAAADQLTPLQAPDWNIQAKADEADIYFYNRKSPYHYSIFDKARRKRGLKIVCDIDDHWELYPHHYMTNFYRQDKSVDKIKANIRNADLVTVTTERLAEAVRLINRNVIVLPNGLPMGHLQFVPTPTAVERVNFIYAGQKSHEADLRILSPVMDMVMDRQPDWGFHLAGYSPAPDGIWDRMADEFTKKGLLPYSKLIANQPIDSYMNVYNEACVVLVPLEDNTFNSYKSNLKILEAAAKGLPVICSRVPPYIDGPEPPVCWAETPDEWYGHMERLANDAGLRHNMALSLQQWAFTHYNLDAINERRFTAFKNLLGKA